MSVKEGLLQRYRDAIITGYSKCHKCVRITGYIQRHIGDIIGVLVVLLLGSMLVFCIWGLIFSLLGHKPHIILHEVEIYGFNVSTSTSTITTTLQITLFCRNNIHDDNVGTNIQKITPPIPVPPKYVRQSKVAVWSPCFNGTAVPMNRDFAGSLARDMTTGGVMIDVIVTGRFRSSNGIVMVSDQMEVSCPMYVTFGNKTDDDNVIGSPVKKPLDEECYSKV